MDPAGCLRSGRMRTRARHGVKWSDENNGQGDVEQQVKLGGHLCRVRLQNWQFTRQQRQQEQCDQDADKTIEQIAKGRRRLAGSPRTPPSRSGLIALPRLAPSTRASAASVVTK